MNELRVDRGRWDNHLNLLVWCEETGYQHTVWTLTELLNSEIDLVGGRFRRYRPHVRGNRVTLPITRADNSFPRLLEWIAETVESGWAMTFTPGEPKQFGVMGLTCVETDLHLHFEDADEAMLCLLKWR